LLQARKDLLLGQETEKVTCLTASFHADWCVMALSAQTGYIMPQEYETHCVGPGTRQTHNKAMKQYTKLKNS